MEIASNRLGDVYRYYMKVLAEIYEDMEARSMLLTLFEYRLGISRVNVLSRHHDRLSESDILKIHKAVLKLKEHIPLQYIIGETSFLDIPIKVEPGVLIPRPETEELVNWIITDVSGSNEDMNILDIGTGSGCIAIALDLNIRHANVFAIDNSPVAIDIARRNNSLNDGRVIIEKADLFEKKLPTSFPDDFDVIVSNPPYVRESEKNMMQANVLNYEPSEALFVSDKDPLLYYRTILDFAKKFLKKNGSVFFEINENMHKELQDLLSDHPSFRHTFKKDMSNKYRMLKLDL